MTRRSLIYLNHNEYTEGLNYYPFIVELDIPNRSCNTLDDPSGRICRVRDKSF